MPRTTKRATLRVPELNSALRPTAHISPCAAPAVDFALTSDLPVILELIRAAGLPLDGFGEVPTEVFVARDPAGIIGVAALESHGSHGLLRSVAVERDRRGSGIGRLLVDAAEGFAKETGVDGIYLLTDTAEEFFAKRGYEVIARDAGPSEVMASVEWDSACGESAVPMLLRTR